VITIFTNALNANLFGVLLATGPTDSAYALLESGDLLHPDRGKSAAGTMADSLQYEASAQRDRLSTAGSGGSSANSEHNRFYEKTNLQLALKTGADHLQVFQRPKSCEDRITNPAIFLSP